METCQWMWAGIWILRLLLCKPFVFWDWLSAASSSASRSAVANDRSCWGSCEDNTFWLTPLIKTGPCVSDWGLQYVDCTLLPNVEPVHQVPPRSFPPLNVTLTISVTSCLRLRLCLFSDHVYIWPRWLNAPPAQNITHVLCQNVLTEGFSRGMKTPVHKLESDFLMNNMRLWLFCLYINRNCCAPQLQHTRVFIMTLL